MWARREQLAKSGDWICNACRSLGRRHEGSAAHESNVMVRHKTGIQLICDSITIVTNSNHFRFDRKSQAFVDCWQSLPGSIRQLGAACRADARLTKLSHPPE